MTDNCGSKIVDDQTAAIHVYNTFTLTAGSDDTYCLNTTPVEALEAVAAGGAGDYSYQWQAYDGTTWVDVPNNGTNDTYTPSVATVGTFRYHAVVTDGQCGTLTSNEVTITVNPLPTITATPATQTITYGDNITDIVLTTTNATVVEPIALPSGLSYNSSTKTISGMPTAANTYTFTVTATSNTTPSCGTAEQEITIVVGRKDLIISLDSSKVYDGTPFEVSFAQLYYDGLVNGDAFTSGTIISDGFQVGDYYCNDGSFTRMWADYTATKNGFGPTSVTQNYKPKFQVVLRITSRPLTLTAASATKVYDGTPLTNNSFTVTSTLGDGDAVSATVNGTLTCLGEADNVIDAATVQVMHDNGNGTFTDVTSDYTPVTLVDGLLKVTPVTTGFFCPASITITLREGNSDTIVPQSLLGTPSHALLTTNLAKATNNLASQNPLTEGVYTVVWTLRDVCDSAMTTCEQLVVVEYEPCSGTVNIGENSYNIKRIGSQCWFTENLREEIGDYHAYNDNVSNLDKFGYLYSWYTTVGVTEGNDNEAPTTLTADNGTPYVQGICPAGWSVGSVEDYHNLDMYAGSVALLKDPSTQYWFSGFQGVEGGTGFNARGGGWYKSSVGHYEDLKTGYHFWQSDATPGSNTVTNWSIPYYCDSMISETNVKSDRKSVRCIRKQVMH